jgi:4-hydroxybenzoate polyprenyltransferase
MTDREDAYVKSRFDNGNYLLSHLLKHLYILLDKFVSFLTISSIFIAIIGFLLPYFSFLLYEVKVNFNLLLASFLLTFAIYNLNKLTDIKEDSVNVPERAGFIEKNKHCVIFAVVASYIAALSLSFLQNPFAIFIILFPFCTGIVYSIKISSFRLKDITGIKNIVIALPWAVIGTFLPLAVSFRDFIIIPLFFYFFFIKCFLNSLLFDIRDIEGDRMSGVRTIPVTFGRQKTKNLLLILNSTLIPWLAISYLSGFFHQYFLVLIFAIAYGYWYIIHFCKEGLKIGKLLDLLVDGEWIPIVIFCFCLPSL